MNGDEGLDKEDQEYKVLFRATDGNKDKSQRSKISTQVQASDLVEFWAKYSEVVKSGMSGLRKKDKKKKTKTKSKVQK